MGEQEALDVVCCAARTIRWRYFVGRGVPDRRFRGVLDGVDKRTSLQEKANLRRLGRARKSFQNDYRAEHQKAEETTVLP